RAIDNSTTRLRQGRRDVSARSAGNRRRPRETLRELGPSASCRLACPERLDVDYPCEVARILANFGVGEGHAAERHVRRGITHVRGFPRPRIDGIEYTAQAMNREVSGAPEMLASGKT